MYYIICTIGKQIKFIHVKLFPQINILGVELH